MLPRSTDTGLAIAFNTTLESASEATQSYRDIYRCSLKLKDIS